MALLSAKILNNDAKRRDEEREATARNGVESDGICHRLHRLHR